MPTPRDLLLRRAADVVCELSLGQAEALAYEIGRQNQPRHIRQVAGLAAPPAVLELCDLWVETEAVEPEALADALVCAARAVKTATSHEKVELLYTGPGAEAMRRNLQGLLEVIRGAHERLWVVSYVLHSGVDEVVMAMHERSQAGVEVKVLLDHRTKGYARAVGRLRTMAPDCRLLTWADEEREFEPGQFANLHAKCVVADGRQAFVSSANLTGWAMDHNIEVGYLVTGGSTPRRLEAHLDSLAATDAFEIDGDG